MVQRVMGGERKGHEESVMAKPKHAISGLYSYRQNFDPKRTIFHTLYFIFFCSVFLHFPQTSSLISFYLKLCFFFCSSKLLFDRSEVLSQNLKRHSNCRNINFITRQTMCHKCLTASNFFQCDFPFVFV